MKRIIRVFPRKTSATPDDDMVRINCGPTLFDKADEVHISVLFTYDLERAKELAYAWQVVAPVTIGGPATGDTGGGFVPGMYVKKGYTIHHRGCPNSCWFCIERKTSVKLLKITGGWNDLSSNLLACPPQHIYKVLSSMRRGRKYYGKAAEFTGGLEAKRLQMWHVRELKKVKPKQMFFAYDTPDDYPWLYAAGWQLHAGGFTFKSRVLRCYVLCGFPNDTFEAAHNRMVQTMECGFMPMAMLYRDESGNRDQAWMKWARQWARPAIIMSNQEKLLR